MLPDMLPGLRERMKIPAADQALVEPFVELITQALRRLRFSGQVVETTDGAQAHVYLAAAQEHRVYRVRLVAFEDYPLESTGLFVEGIQLDENGKGLSNLRPILLPRTKYAVTTESLFLQRGTPVQEVQRLSSEITTSDVSSEAIWNEAEKQLEERRYRK